MRLFRLAHGKCLGAVVLVLAIALSGSARAALVGADDRDSDAPFDITADTVEFESDRDLYIARGNVVITQPGRTLTADWVAFSSDTRQGVATGNVVLTEAEDILYSDVLSFEIDTLKGIVIDGFLDARASGFEMTGETIHKTGEETYTFDDGTFTTCRCPEEGRNPWEIRAKKTDVEVGGYATTRNTSFNILGFPVIWLPWMRYPIKTDRETGFLLPEFSVSGRSGARIGLPFFWAARPNVNVTITPTYLFERGFKPSVDVEYVFGETLLRQLLRHPHLRPGHRAEHLRDSLRPIALGDGVDPRSPPASRLAGQGGRDALLRQCLPLRFLRILELQARALRPVESVPGEALRAREALRVQCRRLVGGRSAESGQPWTGMSSCFNRLPSLQFSGLPQPLPGFARRLQASFNVDYTHFYSRKRAEDVYPRATVGGDDQFLDTGIDAIPDGLEFNEDGILVTARRRCGHA